jgi:hypothetical protein
MACQELVLGKEKEIWRKEGRRGKDISSIEGKDHNEI